MYRKPDLLSSFNWTKLWKLQGFFNWTNNASSDTPIYKKVQSIPIIIDYWKQKSHQNLSGYIQFLFFLKLNIIQKMIISSENMKNSDNYNYGHSFFGKEGLDPSRYTG